MDQQQKFFSRRFWLIILVGAMIFPGRLSASNENEDHPDLKRWSNLAWDFRNTNPDSSLFYASKALEASTTNGNLKIMAYSLSDMASFYMLKEEYDHSESLLRKSLIIRKQLGQAKDVASGYNNLGRLFNYRQEYDSATVYLEEGLAIAEHYNLLKMRGIIMNVLSTTMTALHQFEASEELILQSIEIATELKDSAALASRLQNLGSLYQQIHRYQHAYENYSESFSICQKLGDVKGQVDLLINQGSIRLLEGSIDSAISFFNEAERLTNKFGLLDNRSAIFNNLGYAYTVKREYQSAKEVLEKGRLVASKHDRPHFFIKMSINLAGAYLAQNAFAEALKTSREIDSVLRENAIVRYRVEFYKIKSEALAGIGSYSDALKARLKADQIKDSLNLLVDNAQESLAQMEQLKRDEIILKERNNLQAARILQQYAEARSQNLIIGIILLVLLSITGFLFLRNRSIRIKARALAEKKKSDEKVKELLAGINQRMLETQIEANNETSFKIGQNLHDNLGSKLAVVQTSMEGIRKKVHSPDENIEQRFDKVEALLEQSCDDLRTIAHDLQDRELTQRSFEREIEHFIELINASGEIEIHVKKGVVPKALNRQTQGEIVAIARLLIENVLRHAKASEITIEFKTQGESFVLSISDDGVGFDPTDASVASGRGLKNARLRAVNIHGQFKVISKPGLGTKAMLHLPVSNL